MLNGQQKEYFPFNNIIIRINSSLYKYLEQPSMLDNIIELLLGHFLHTIRIYIEIHINCYKREDKIESVNSEFM